MDVNTTVVGMRNVHVVDASILAPVTVNPQFAVMAAAERAAELILGVAGVGCSFCDKATSATTERSYGSYGNYGGYASYGSYKN